MSARRFRDAALGTGVSLLVHTGLLVVLGGCLDRLKVPPTERLLAVAIWTEPEPKVTPEQPAEDVSARTVETAEPAPAEVEAEEPPEPSSETRPVETETSEPVAEPREPIVIPEPPAETARPELPEIGAPSIETDLPISPLADIIETPPAGPGEADRGRIIGERLTSSAERAARRAAQLEGTGRTRPVAGLEREADTLMVPAGDTPLASEKGVIGPLGKRHILYSETPEYPAWARRLGLEAELRFRIWVTPEGVVSRVEVMERSGSTELDALAEHALRQWRFQPLPRTVSSRDEWGEIPMSFTLVAN